MPVVGTAIGAAIGGVVGLVAAPAVAAVGAGVGAAGGGIRNAVENSNDQKQIDELTELYKKEGSAVFDKERLKELGFEDVSDEYVNQLRKVVEA
jgi:uncharacterized protein YcfJ